MELIKDVWNEVENGTSFIYFASPADLHTYNYSSSAHSTYSNWHHHDIYLVGGIDIGMYWNIIDSKCLDTTMMMKRDGGTKEEGKKLLSSEWVWVDQKPILLLLLFRDSQCETWWAFIGGRERERKKKEGFNSH